MKKLAWFLSGLLVASAADAATNSVSGGGANLQTAINAAQDGDVLFVASGTYSPIVTGNKDIRIESTGGASVTFIDGGGAERCATLGTENGHTNTVLIGFTLANGHANVTILAHHGGGAVCGTLGNCTLTNNTGYAYGGGAAYSILTGCTLVDNMAVVDGGGAYLCTLDSCMLTNNMADAFGGGACRSALLNCTLADNAAGLQGGGADDCTLENCAITNNTANSGGGAYHCTLDNCTLSGNLAAHRGGGAYYSTLNDCTFSGNTADYDGGGAYYSILNRCALTDNESGRYGGGAAHGLLNNCILTDNTAWGDEEWSPCGGGAYESMLNNCLLTGNYAEYGGGAFESTLNNCTLYGNTAFSVGGGVRFGALNNCVAWGNTVLHDPFEGHNHYECVLMHSCSTPMPIGAFDGGSNTNANPLFVSAANGDFRLQTGSPCVDTGANILVVGGTDLDGNRRIWGSAVDMGAYERDASPLPGQIFYVDRERLDDSGDGRTWATAKKTIQGAVIDAVAGDTVVVTNGTYTFVMTLNKAIRIESVNGAEATRINGNGIFRCATLGQEMYPSLGATLAGFTLTNGRAPYGGGAAYGTLENCTLEGNRADDSGGGAYDSTLNHCTLSGNTAECYGGGAAYGTLNDCTLTGNTAADGGGAYESWLFDCALTGNTAFDGGGASWSTLNNCTLSGNTAENGGGAADSWLYDCALTNNTAVEKGGGAYESTLYNCTLSGNTADYGGGMVYGWALCCTLSGNTTDFNGGGACESWLHSCLLTGNRANDSGGGAEGSELVNCTLSGNMAYHDGGGAHEGTLNNCIVWGNTVTSGAYSNHYEATFAFSCTAPAPTSGYNGGGNIALDPLFVSPATGNYRLQSGSSCINAGNNTYVAWDIDLDGNPRIWGGRVDMGCYEHGSRWDATVYYADDTRPDNSGDGLSWATAKKTLQAAVDLALLPGDRVVVTNGIYFPIVVLDDLAITIQSVNGAALTFIDGNGIDRCATLGSSYGHTATVLDGFTLINGYAAYGITPVEPGNGGGSCYGTLNHCVLSGNKAEWNGGGAYGGELNHCTLTGNKAGGGGGAYEGTLNHCTLSGNEAEWNGGGACYSTLNNCLLTGNTAGDSGGAADGSELNNCTLSDNTAECGGGVLGGFLFNCIAWGNNSSGEFSNYCDTAIHYTCTAPLPEYGVGNIDANPMFADAPGGNFRLQSGSLCIDAGDNTYATWDIDLDGNPRIWGGRVDMGAYEFGSRWDATVFYADENRPDDSGDGLSWATAKHTLQAAVDLALLPGDTVVATNGTYAPITSGGRAITIRSVEGAGHTSIDGGGTNRCASLTSFVAAFDNTVLIGFTLANGYAEYNGGGAYGGTLNNCILTGNTAEYNGGGAYDSVLNHCTLSGNTANCIGMDLNGGGGAADSTLNNCLLTGNTAHSAGGGAFESTLNNCTVSDNTAHDDGGGVRGGSALNCVVWGNTQTGGNGGAFSNHYLTTFAFSCTIPAPPQGYNDGGNINFDPLFVNPATGDYRLQPASPCIDAGGNEYVTWDLDLDGNLRIWGGHVDMGAYEFGSVPGGGGDDDLTLLLITRITVGDPIPVSPPMREIILDFTYDGTLPPTVHARMWLDLADLGASSVPTCFLDDPGGGAATLTVILPADLAKAFFRIEAP
ncbi:MAG: hypothetical protein FWG50_04305 [Kiritimatiellaeota bacterium]|nr:hypothetical protein [Kiritimatiellota bacterium]